MNSSNPFLKFNMGITAQRNPGFARIIAFDYYDGPERGLAIYPLGHGVRFSSLGDSQSRLFRAFELVTLEGNWWDYVYATIEISTSSGGSCEIVPNKNLDAIAELEKRTFDAAINGYFLGIGPGNMSWLAVTGSSKEEIEYLRTLPHPRAFREIHRLIKN